MDHPTSPVAWTCTPTSPEPNQPIDDIANQNNLWFLDFFSKVVFFAIFAHFGPICALPWATPWHFFHFFLIGCCEWSIVLLISSKKSGTFSFFFIIFSSFSPIFQKNDFLAHLAHFTPPHGPPHIPCGLNLYPHIPWAQPTYRWHCVSK